MGARGYDRLLIRHLGDMGLQQGCDTFVDRSIGNAPSSTSASDGAIDCKSPAVLNKGSVAVSGRGGGSCEGREIASDDCGSRSFVAVKSF